MEPITAIATAIATLIFTEAFKEGGKALGKNAYEKGVQLVAAIREKFKSASMEGVLIQAEKQPTEANKLVFQSILETQMTSDEAFANKLAELVKQIQSTGDTKIQEMLSGIKVTENIEIKGDINQKSRGYGSLKMLTDIQAQNIKIDGNLNQES